MRHRPKALFCDVDRTLLTHDHVLLPAVTSAMNDLIDGGIQIILATARSPRGVSHIQERLGIDGLTICFNGAWIGEINAPVPWQQTSMPRLEALDVVRCAIEGGMTPMWYTGSDVQALNRFEVTARKQAAVTQDNLVLTPSIDGLSGDPLKVMIVVPPEQVEAALLQLRDTCDATVAVMRSGPGLIEIVRKGVNKAQAARAVAEMHGLCAGACAAVGDSENDIEMLRWAGMPLTVLNGIVEAQRIACFVGGHCDQAGFVAVADWLLSLPVE